MRRLVIVVATLLASSWLVACDAGPGAIIRVDSSHDTFAATMIGFFPEVVVVHPGDTVRFRQRWTGEPHSVTFGSFFNDELGRIRERILSDSPTAAESMPEMALFDTLPVMLGREGDEFAVNQNGAQPCYLDEGRPPEDPDEACAPRAQPRFTGTHSYYSSGFIPYLGADLNRFDVEMADDVRPGSYHFYCNLHGVGQSGTVLVVPSDEPLPSQRTVDGRTQATITDTYSRPLADALDSARRDELTLEGIRYGLPLAGAASATVRPWNSAAHRRHLGHHHGSVDEFVPRVVRAVVGEPVTWTFVGRHTVSFNVPKYLPVFDVGKDGTVRLDPRVHEPAGWTIPDRSPDGPMVVDAGQWDGRGFHSTGLDWTTGDQFLVTFTRPGSYLLACLIHPAMVGKVVVS